MSRFHRHALIGFLLVLAGCGTTPEVNPDPGTPPDEATPPPSPPPAVETPPPDPCDGLAASEGQSMGLVLDSPGPAALRATLCNLSDRDVRVLVNHCGLLGDLALTHESQGPLVPFDRRSIMSCSGTVRSSAFLPVAAGGSLEIERAEVVRIGGANQLTFGTRFFGDIPPGSLTARLTFETRGRSSSDQPVIEDAWTGRLESNEVTLQVPPG